MTFLVECYWPGLTQARAEKAAARLAAGGPEIAFRSAIVVPADEVVLCLFEADSAAGVPELCRRAGLPCDRILQVTQLGA